MNNICNYLTDSALHTYITTPKENDKYDNLFHLFKDKLDEKYGDNTGAKVYTYLANICKYDTHYGECESLEKNLNKQKILAKKINKATNSQNISEEKRNNLLKTYNTMLNMNIEYYNSLKEKGNVSKVADGTKRLPFNNSEITKYKYQQEEELSEFNDFVLSLISKDFSNISTKEDAQKALVNWNLYKTTCLPSSKGFLISNNLKSEIPLQLASDKAKEVQTLLFKKCKETGLFNDNVNKKIFNAVLDANINDIKNVKIIKNNNKNKLYVIDKYAINTLSYSKNANLYNLNDVEEYSSKIANNLKGEKFDFTNSSKEIAIER